MLLIYLVINILEEGREEMSSKEWRLFHGGSQRELACDGSWSESGVTKEKSEVDVSKENKNDETG